MRFKLEISEKFQTLYGISGTFRIIGFTSMNPEKIKSHLGLDGLIRSENFPLHLHADQNLFVSKISSHKWNLFSC